MRTRGSFMLGVKLDRLNGHLMATVIHGLDREDPRLTATHALRERPVILSEDEETFLRKWREMCKTQGFENEVTVA